MNENKIEKDKLIIEKEILKNQINIIKQQKLWNILSSDINIFE